MKLVDMTCPGCGANLRAKPEDRVAVCASCGKQVMLVHTGEYGEGYDREMGRIQAQRDVEAKWKEEREASIRQRELDKKLLREKQEKDRIKKQLKCICGVEAVICVLFFIVSLLYDGPIFQKYIRMPASFIQLALIAAICLFFTKDKYYKQIVLACILCAVVGCVTTFFSVTLIWVVLFNLLKLIWMIRIERVSSSWRDIFSFSKGSQANE